jgi:hypothetical protein
MESNSLWAKHSIKVPMGKRAKRFFAGVSMLAVLACQPGPLRPL